MKTRRRSLQISVLTAVVAIAAFWSNHGHADAPPGRYVISNGTVFDTETLLTWQQTLPTTLYTWANAITYCTGLNLNGTGWRLPSVKELGTIVDETRMNPAIDTTAFPNTSSVFFWTSSPWADYSTHAWVVSFDYGNAAGYNVAGTYQVRCVR